MKLTGGEMIARFLVNQGVPYVAGIPGHGALPLTDALFKMKHKIRPIQVRQEMSAVHIADGYFRVTGRPLAAFTSIGPGAINTAIGVATCFVDSTPCMVFAGDTHTYMHGKGVLQEIERKTDSGFSSMFEPITKRVFKVNDVRMLPNVLRRAWQVMMGGRKGPVLISLPMDVQADSCDVKADELRVSESNLLPEPDPTAIHEAVNLLKTAKRPMILAGGGVLYNCAAPLLREVAELIGAPVMTTLQGKSAFPENHPLSAWLGGSKGTMIGNTMAPKADVLLAIGTRFADETSSSYREGITYSRKTKLIHIDLDPHEIGKNYYANVPIIADANKALAALKLGLENAGLTRNYEETEYFAELQQVKQAWFDKLEQTRQKGDGITVSQLLYELRKALPADTYIAHSSGHTQASILSEFPFSVPGTCLTTAGFSTMGWALPAAMGAKLACPDRPCVSVTGDGDFMMTMQELSTAVQHEIPVVHVISNNSGWISIRDLQIDAFGADRAHMTEFTNDGKLVTPDFFAVAKAFGCYARKVTKREDIAKAVQAALKAKRPAVVEVIVNREHPVSGSAATGWWDVPIPTYLAAKRKKYESERDEEVL